MGLDWKTYEALGLHLSMNEETSPRIVNGRTNREIQQALGDARRPAIPSETRKPFRPTRTAARRRALAPRLGPLERLPRCKARPLIYAPAGFDPAGPAPALMVFQDGGGYLNREGPIRAAARVRHPARSR